MPLNALINALTQPVENTQKLQVIYDDVSRTAAVTPTAINNKSAFFSWYNTLKASDKTLDRTLTEAKRRQSAFHLSNKPPVATTSKTVLGITRAAPTNTSVSAPASNTAAKSADIASAIQTTRPTIREGSTGPAVQEWQHIIGVSADGKFGPATKAKTIEWQRARGLTPDGIVGPATWGRALMSSSPAPVKGPVDMVMDVLTVSSAKPSLVNTTPVPIVTPGLKPTIKEGSTGPYVVEWQNIVGVSPDGKFGPATKSATQSWQRARSLTADGIVGPATWSRAQAESAGALVMPAVDIATAAAQAAIGTVANQSAPPASIPAAAAAAAAAVQNPSTAPPFTGSAAPVTPTVPKAALPLWMVVTGAIFGSGVAVMAWKKITGS